MKGDFTRNTFDPKKHYRSVLMQQGRVQLDADWNENLAIGSHLLQTLTRDVIGECGVPIHVDAFKIDVPSPIDPAQLDFKILAGPQRKGRMYVNGLLIEIEDPTTYLTQPAPDGTTLAELGPQLPTLKDGETRVDRVYIDVWSRTISAIEDPHIREIALGGPDTAERVKLIWQVKVQPNVGPDARCNDPIDVPPIGGGTAKLIVSTPAVPPDPCEPTAQGGYQGPDNRFYRIEIHDGGQLGTGVSPGTATFKWSRDNGSVVAAVEQFKSSTEVVVKSLGRDDYLKFKTGDFVEITDDATELSGLPGTLASIAVDEASRTLTLSTALPDAVWQAAERHPKVRRWDGGNAQTITDAPIDLEAGLAVQFEATPNVFRSGDYWTFAARVVDGSLDPTLSAATPPMGVRHAFCALALITWRHSGGTVTATVEDCRLTFPPLTEIPRGEDCCTVSVGDGVTSRGGFTDIQVAIDSLKNGGRVCILPGQYHLKEAVRIHKLSNVIISGCGPQTRISAIDKTPAFIVDDSNRITLESLTLIGQSIDGVIVINTSRVVRVTDCEISNVAAGEDNPPSAVFPNAHANGPAINVSDSLMVTIANNTLFGLPAVSSQAHIVEIDDNHLLGGGIWVRDGSGKVEIHANDISGGLGAGIIISGGLGAGIILGGLGQNKEPSDRRTGVEGVQIFDNRISHMAGSGISTLGTKREPSGAPGVVSDVTISDNRIVECVTTATDQFTNEIALGGIVLGHVARVRIHHNTIANNGAAQGNPANGILVFLCEGLEITDNSITGNGTTIAADRQLSCIDFSAMDIGEGENPRKEAGASFAVLDAQGSQQNPTQVQSMSGFTGLDCGFRTEITLDAVSSSVEVTLVSFSKSGLVEVFDEHGSSTVQIDPALQAKPQTITLHGTAIKSVRIVAPLQGVLLQKTCVDASGAGFQAGIAALYVLGLDTTGTQGNLTSPLAQKLGATIPAAFIHDNVVICPQGHALIAIGLGAMSIADNTLMSRGIRRQPDLPILPPGQAASINALIKLTSCVLIYNLGQPRERVPGFGTSVNTHFETAPFNTTAVNATGFIAPLQLPDGRVLFNDNQVTLQDFDVRGRRLLSIPVAILSGDDVSMQDNQIDTEIPQVVLDIDTVVIGTTVRVSDNRTTEVPGQVRLSCLSKGQRNITTGNQTTHCLLAQGGEVVNTQNQQLITKLCEQLTKLFGGT